MKRNHLFWALSRFFVVDDDFVTPLLAYKDRLFEIFGGALMISNEYSAVRLAGLRGLHLMTLIKSFLSANEVGLQQTT